METWGSKYALVVLAAKRAKQIKSGARPLVDTDSRNPLTIALEEIAAGKVICHVAETDALPSAVGQPEVAELLAIPEREEEEIEAIAEVAEIEASAAGTEEAVSEKEAEHEEIEEEEEEGLLEWEEEEEEHEEELPFHEDIDIVVGLEPDIEEVVAETHDEEAKPKPRGRRKKAAEPDVEVIPESVDLADDEEDD